ncbi:MAG: hypothetical protein U0163_19515 [Gemmatimonadaceae bacterium]
MGSGVARFPLFVGRLINRQLRTKPFRLALGLIVLAAAGGMAQAQGSWSAVVDVLPFPSPYLSDWETNPNVSSLTLENRTGQVQSVRLVYRITDRAGRVLANGRSDPQVIPSGEPTVITDYLQVTGTSSHDGGIEDQMKRTGRLPEGAYRVCVTVTDLGGFVLAQTCADFTIVYPDPPMLVAPDAGATIRSPDLFLQWTPLQLPAEYQVHFALQIAEVLSNQTPSEALASTILQYSAGDIDVTNWQYPLDAPPLVSGKRYAWRVVALDQYGYAPSANRGMSEIRTFVYDERADAGPTVARASFSLSVTNAFDTDPDDTETTTLAGDAAPQPISDLCTTPDPSSSGYTLNVDVPFVKRFTGSPATMYRDTSTSEWWIRTTNPSGRRDVLMYGDCEALRGGARVRWIASRNSDLQQRINQLLASPVVEALPQSVAPVSSIDLGMVVVSLGAFTVTAPDSFPEGRAFLKDVDGKVHTFDVALGLNLYSVIGLKEMPLWKVFQLLGFDEKQLELYGFIGMDASWSVGTSLALSTESGDPGVDVSRERNFLVLHANLPERKPIGPFTPMFQSQRLELDLTVKDSTGWSLDRSKGTTSHATAASVEVVASLIHRIVVNKDLELTATVAFDGGRSTSKGLAGEALSRVAFATGWRGSDSSQAVPKADYSRDLVISYAAAGKLALTPNIPLNAVQLDIKLNLDEDKQVYIVSGAFPLGGVDEAMKIGMSLERKGAKAATTTKSVATLQGELDAARKERDGRRPGPGRPVPDCKTEPQDDDDKAFCESDQKVRTVEVQLANAKQAELDAAEAKESGTPPSTGSSTATPAAKAEWAWRARASFGHMSLGSVLALLRGTP